MAFIKHNYNIGPLTWLKVGGVVKTFFIPKNYDEIVDFLRDNKDTIIVLGAVSNSLFLDGPWDGAVIKTTHLNAIELLDNYQIKAQCGVLDKVLSNFALKHSIGGLEFLDSIPGTVGGNILTNAGCYGSEIKDIFVALEYINFEGQLKTLTKNDIIFSYRHGQLPKDCLMIYSVIFQGYRDSTENIMAIMKQMEAQRLGTQPVGISTCGSTFANPKDHKAWQLIEQSGAKNLIVNGAQWSKIHCNFLHNRGTSADDIYDLCLQTQHLVKEKTNIELSFEIFIFGTRKK
jgi:UDP-N-acetylmuramate dehydrogenase